MGASATLRSVGLLHPTFESWGGAEWFIHQFLESLGPGEGAHTVYTHRWSPPPGEASRRPGPSAADGRSVYAVVAHRRGGVLSAPWDWMKIARELSGRWRRHQVIFIHNWPATQWYHEGSGRSVLPPAVWYCHEPPALLYSDLDSRESPPEALPGPGSLWSSLRFYGVRAPWRLVSRARAHRAMRAGGDGEWEEDLRQRDKVAVGGLPLILANSRFTAGRVREIYGREAQVVHPVPPDLASLRPGSTSTKAKEILFVGRLTPAKRPHLLLSAWQQALDMEPALAGYRLVMVGDGPLRDAVLERVARLGLGGQAVLWRNLSRRDLVECYRRAMLTVHLGVAEPFGLVPLESMAAGTAVLAEGDGGARETILEGETGWAVEGLDEPSLADRLARVPAAHARLEEMGRAASDHVMSRFSAARSLGVLRECLAAAARQGTGF